MKPGAVRVALACAAASAFAVLAPAGASAFTKVKVNEVFPGTPAAFDKAFIELKLTADGQQLLSGHEVVIYNAAGAVNQSFVIPGDVPLGQSQRTVLIGDIDVTNADFYGNFGTLISFAGGAVCFPDAIPADCVAWGSFSAPGSLSAPVGTNVAPAGIPNGGTNASALVRTAISAGCPTALDDADDLNDSASEFSVTDAETPDANADPVKTPACPQPAKKKKKCKKKKRKGKAGASAKKKRKKKCRKKKRKKK